VRTAVCIASGPSLTEKDCLSVRRWRDSAKGRGVVVTNTTFRLCPWADALYGMDNEWWRVYGDEVAKTFAGATYSRFGNYGTRRVRIHGHNSGAGAILLASNLGAKRIILLGYDGGFVGRRHWHDDHKRPLGNCESVAKWSGHFESVRQALTDTEILNASRETRLSAFPVVSLESVL